MKTSIRTTFAAIVLSAAFAGTASANAPAQSLQGAVQSALGGSGQVQVTLNNGVATLFGYVEDGGAELSVKQAAENFPGVDRIVDLISEG